MVELTVGSRFWYKNKLCEVVEGECALNYCVFKNKNKCDKAKCFFGERHDNKKVYFKEVKNE